MENFYDRVVALIQDNGEQPFLGAMSLIIAFWIIFAPRSGANWAVKEED